MHVSLELLYGWIERKVVNTGDRAELLERVNAVRQYVEQLEMAVIIDEPNEPVVP